MQPLIMSYRGRDWLLRSSGKFKYEGKYLATIKRINSRRWSMDGKWMCWICEANGRIVHTKKLSSAQALFHYASNYLDELESSCE